jgi:hypothetical protein
MAILSLIGLHHREKNGDSDYIVLFEPGGESALILQRLIVWQESPERQKVRADHLTTNSHKLEKEEDLGGRNNEENIQQEISALDRLPPVPKACPGFALSQHGEQHYRQRLSQKELTAHLGRRSSPLDAGR